MQKQTVVQTHRARSRAKYPRAKSSLHTATCTRTQTHVQAHLCSHSHPRVHTLLCTQPFAHCTHFHLSTPSCANCHIHVQRSSCTLSHGHGHAGECAKPCIHAQIPPCTLLGFHTHTHVCKTDRRAKTFLHTYTITQACKTTHPRANIPLHTMCKKHLARSHPCAHICTPLHMHRAMRKHIHVCNPVPLHTHVQTPPCTPLCVLHSCITAPSLHSPRPHARVQIDHYTFDMHPCATSLAHSCANSALATPISRCVQPRCAMFCTLTCVQMRAHSCTPTCKTSLCIPMQPFLAHACAQIHALVQQPRVQNPTATCKGLHSHCGALAQV